MQRFFTILAATAVASLNSITQADLAGFEDYDEWTSNVGDFSTIDFTQPPAGTLVTDQYADLGVQFTDGNDFTVQNSGYVNDGAGLHGSNIDHQITVEFDTPQLWFGVDHPGIAVLDVYAGGEFQGSFQHTGGFFGVFTGVLSDTAFDKVVILRGTANSAARIDDMHWGVPAPGGVAALALSRPARRVAPAAGVVARSARSEPACPHARQRREAVWRQLRE